MYEPAAVRISTPFDEAIIATLHAGDNVLLSGVIYTARDAAHKRLVTSLNQGESLPLELSGQVLYYVGPTPAKPGQVIGSAGPTTSYRMDSYTPALLAQGLKGMIGKGQRNEAVRQSIRKYRAVYFAATGGAAALIARSIISSEVIAYEDLGPEAIRRLVVKDLPLIVINDSEGADLYAQVWASLC